MPEMSITAIRLATSPEDAATRVLARFDCILGPVAFIGCLLKRHKNGRPIAVMPRFVARGASVRMFNDTDHHRLCRLADEAYKAAVAVPGDDA